MPDVNDIAERDRLRRAPTPEFKYFLSAAHDAVYQVRGSLTEREADFIGFAMFSPFTDSNGAQFVDAPLLARRDACWLLAAKYAALLPWSVVNQPESVPGEISFGMTAQRLYRAMSLRRRVAALRAIYGDP